MGTAKWIYCPICKNKTRTKIRTDTKLINFPLYCPKCKQENLRSQVLPCDYADSNTIFKGMILNDY